MWKTPELMPLASKPAEITWEWQEICSCRSDEFTLIRNARTANGGWWIYGRNKKDNCRGNSCTHISRGSPRKKYETEEPCGIVTLLCWAHGCSSVQPPYELRENAKTKVLDPLKIRLKKYLNKIIKIIIRTQPRFQIRHANVKYLTVGNATVS